jgi:hypothetical protein
MQRFWSTFRELSEALPIRRVLAEHALLIGVGVVVLVLCFAYPKLLIPLLGLGLPFYAGSSETRLSARQSRKSALSIFPSWVTQAC